MNGEKRVATRLLVHQLRQRGDAFRLAAKRIRNQLAEVFMGQRRKRNLLHQRSSLADSIERAKKRMRRIDLVVPVGADQQQVPHFRVRNQML